MKPKAMINVHAKNQIELSHYAFKKAIATKGLENKKKFWGYFSQIKADKQKKHPRKYKTRYVEQKDGDENSPL